MLHEIPGRIDKERRRNRARLSIVPADAQKPGSFFHADSFKDNAANVVVVDDRLTSRQITSELLLDIDGSLSLQSYSSPAQALAQAGVTPPDLLITDYKMPGMNGIELMQRVRALPGCHDVPVMIVTVCEDREIRYRALQAGVNDFLVRPLDQREYQARCRNLLMQRQTHAKLKTRLSWLEQKMLASSMQVRGLEQELLMRLARAGEYRDEITGTHVFRMAKYARLIAEGLQLSPGECEEIEVAAPMHDIGKIGIADDILLKPGRLNEQERKIMREHAQIGYEILKDSSSNYLQLGAVAALNHHERFDGTGYPRGLKGDEIPLIARIVAVADVFDALTSPRPYKDPWSADEASMYLKSNSGTHFDPDCVNAFLVHRERVEHIRQAAP